MSNGWSENDKAVVRTALERARRRAEQEALALHANYRIQTIEDLWALELKIREWRKERQTIFRFSYESAHRTIAELLSCGWLKQSELAHLSPDRLATILAIKKQA